MNIRSVTTEAVSQPLPASPPQFPATAASSAGPDSFQPAQNEKLVNMLQEQPEVRPDAVERAKSMADDPNYPGAGAIAGLAKLLIADASEE